MSLVGDIIMQLRRRIPDAPQAFQLTGTPLITAVTDPNGQFGPGPDFWFKVTNTNEFGETNACPEIGPLTLTGTQNAFQISWVSTPSLTSGQRTMKVYIGIYANGETSVQIIPFVAGVAVYTITGQNLVDGLPPSRSTCFFPDSDGNFLGAYSAYDLLNQAITEMVKIAGGIVDVTGVQSSVNQSMYRIDTPSGQGSFYQFTNAWFDGYPMDVVQRSMMYLRNSAAGFSGILSYEQDGPSSVIQVWPQSNRTGGEASVIGLINPDDNAFFADLGGANFLSIGLAQIDDEVVAYSQVQQQSSPGLGTYYLFSGVARGMSGTIPTTHQAGAPVTELNIRLSGYRMPPIYQVGHSAQTLMVPQAWDQALVLHMLSQVRSMEQDDAAAKSLLGDFVQAAEKVAKGSRLGRLKPRQIPIWGQNTSDARNVNGIGFGWLVQ